MKIFKSILTNNFLELRISDSQKVGRFYLLDNNFNRVVFSKDDSLNLFGSLQFTGKLKKRVCLMKNLIEIEVSKNYVQGYLL